MARPSYSDIASGQQGWDATLNDWKAGLFTNPYALPRVADFASLPAAANYEHCIAVVQDEHRAYMSDGTHWIPMDGILANEETDASIASVVEDDFHVYSMPAGLMKLNGMALKLTSWFTSTPFTDPAEYRVKLGSSTIASFTEQGAEASTHIKCVCYLQRSGAAAGKGWVEWAEYGADGAADKLFRDVLSFAPTWANALDVKFSGLDAAGGATQTQHAFLVELENAKGV